MDRYDVAVIGAGPAGLAAAGEAAKCGAKVLLVEREARTGGILKQCIHDGFGLIKYGERLAGCEYAARAADALKQTDAEISTLTFVSAARKREDGRFELTLVTRGGMRHVEANAIVLCTGCRERTAKQVWIHGTRPAGVYTAGTAQYLINVMGIMPTKRCVILGSGDIGLIMARRLTLEGAEVVGVYEAKPTPSGLSRNIAQCLNDFNIPLHLSHTVTRLHGDRRLTGVTISEVDAAMRPVEGTGQTVDCDALILSVGLIPENELAESLGVPLDGRTKGAICDQRLMSRVGGVFVCGNALHVNDLVDYVSESGETAGRAAACYNGGETDAVPLEATKDFLYAVPQYIDRSGGDAVVYFRTSSERSKTRVTLRCGGRKLFERVYGSLRPPEMERFAFKTDGIDGPLALEMENI